MKISATRKMEIFTDIADYLGILNENMNMHTLTLYIPTPIWPDLQTYIDPRVSGHTIWEARGQWRDVDDKWHVDAITVVRLGHLSTLRLHAILADVRRVLGCAGEHSVAYEVHPDALTIEPVSAG